MLHLGRICWKTVLLFLTLTLPATGLAQSHSGELVMTLASASGYQLATYDGKTLKTLWPRSRFAKELFMTSNGLVVLRVIKPGAGFPTRRPGWMLWSRRSRNVTPMLTGSLAADGSIFLRGRYYGEPTPFWKDNSFFLFEHRKYDLIVRRAFVGKQPKPFLKLHGLYDFETRADRCYAYVIWGRTGTESRDFVDLIPGKPMSLWWVCPGKKPRMLTRGASIQKMQFVQNSRSLIYLQPEKRGSLKLWTLVRLDPLKGTKRVVADIPAPYRSRGTPTLLAWRDQPRVVYPSHQTHRSQPMRFRRHNLLTGQVKELFSTRPGTTVMAGSPSGFVVLRTWIARQNLIAVHSAVSGRLVLNCQIHQRPGKILYLPTR